MTKGPIEALAARLEAIEARAGLKLEAVRRRARSKGRPGAADRWLSDRLRRDHPEALDRTEQDMLGNALLWEQRGELAEAQRLLDLLAEHHALRLELRRATSDENGGGDETSD